jgi:hypothetical protein
VFARGAGLGSTLGFDTGIGVTRELGDRRFGAVGVVRIGLATLRQSAGP